jgi:hypothetical protein
MKPKTAPLRRNQTEFFVGLIFLLCVTGIAATYACLAFMTG